MKPYIANSRLQPEQLEDMAPTPATERFARLVVDFTHGIFAIRKARKPLPHPSRAKITASYHITEANKSGGSAAVNTGTYFGNSFNTRVDDEDDDNLRGECYPDNDDRDVDFKSLDGSSGLESEDCSESSDSHSAAEKVCPFDCDYGDLEETGGYYAVQYEDGSEVTLEEHELDCGCDLDDEELMYRRVLAGSVEQSDDESDYESD
jgi:hypothetical protein